MAIDWGLLEYSPALIGGALIGLASALLILGAGRMAGIAGIVGGRAAKPRARPASRGAMRSAGPSSAGC